MKNPEGKPRAVQELIRGTARNDPRAIERHRAMSRKGGKAAAESNRLKREQQQHEDALRAAIRAEEAKRAVVDDPAKVYTESEEGDILPPDPEVLQ